MSEETYAQKIKRLDLRLFRREMTLLELTELICETMEKENVSKIELARRLGRSQGYITRILGGQINLSIRMISDIFTALNATLHFKGDAIS